MIAPPGVFEVNFPTITAGHAGRIAISFPGSPVNDKNDNRRPWNQYVVVSTDALSPDPLFVWATGNDTADPVHRGLCLGRCGGMFDFLDIVTSPKDGMFWATASDTCVGTCVTGSGATKQVGDGVAIKQTGGPSLMVPTAVTVASLSGRATRSGVALTWRTGSEVGVAGFNVWRFTGAKGVKVNRTLVAAKAGGSARGAVYRLLDRGVRRGVSYTYRLQAVGLDGTRAWRASTSVRTRR